LFTTTLNTSVAFPSLLVVVIGPEKKPEPLQGEAKAAWATECVLGKKWNSRVVFTSAVVTFGEKVRSPLALPTRIVWVGSEGEVLVVEEATVELEAVVAARVKGRAARRKLVVLKCIVIAI